MCSELLLLVNLIFSQSKAQEVNLDALCFRLRDLCNDMRASMRTSFMEIEERRRKRNPRGLRYRFDRITNRPQYLPRPEAHFVNGTQEFVLRDSDAYALLGPQSQRSITADLRLNRLKVAPGNDYYHAIIVHNCLAK